MAGKNRSIDAEAQVDELAARLVGTAAETVDDPDYIVNRATAHYGELQGLAVMLRLIEQHISTPQIREYDGTTHTETFVPGIGPIQLTCWPRGAFVEGEEPYLALMFADDDADIN